VVREQGAEEIRPEDRYEDLIVELAGVAGVTLPQANRGFGRSALRFQSKIFVMLVRGQLVLKLPAERVDLLVAAGDGVRFDANKGTPMREWLSLDPGSGQSWLLLAREALDFARSGQRNLLGDEIHNSETKCLTQRQAFRRLPTGGRQPPLPEGDTT
jgi:hypothetical protein